MKVTSPRKGTARVPAATPAPRAAKTARPVVAAVNAGNGAAPRRQASSARAFILSQDQIAQRAYQIWEQTGNPDENWNWQEAERQLRIELGVA